MAKKIGRGRQILLFFQSRQTLGQRLVHHLVSIAAKRNPVLAPDSDRRSRLSSTMPQYLVQRLTENPNIELHFHTEIVALEGESSLERIVWRERNTGEIDAHSIQHLFLMTGAAPRTEWLRGYVALETRDSALRGAIWIRPVCKEA